MSKSAKPNRAQVTEWSDRETAGKAAAHFLAEALRHQLADEPRVVLIVSGGSSPLLCLSMLSNAELDWSRVDVTLTDERRVPVSDDQSNEKMVRETLIQSKARDAEFVPLAVENLERILKHRSVNLMGMGEDGHFASIFPDLSLLEKLTDVGEPPGIFDITTNASEVPRRTLNLSALSRSTASILLAFGAGKKRVLDNPAGLPVEQLLTQPIEVYWAP